MEREAFLDSVAHRLGRPRVGAAPRRPDLHAPWPLVESPLKERFCSELERLGGTWSRANSSFELARQVSSAIDLSGDAPSISVARSCLAELGLDARHPPLERLVPWGDGGIPDKEEFRTLALQADLGVTTAVSAVAATGTLLLAASCEAPRAVSLLPRRHLAIVRESQIVADLSAALSLGTRAIPSHLEMPSALICVSGPSRTSDIENDLSIGVHGPAEVHVIIYAEASS